MVGIHTELARFEADAAQVARLLHALANPRRLMILCKLVEWGEATVGALAEAVGLGKSALSPREDARGGLSHLPLRSQTLWYRNGGPRAEVLLAHLQRLYCPE
jgi:ArsR family transcriptional regulator